MREKGKNALFNVFGEKFLSSSFPYPKKCFPSPLPEAIFIVPLINGQNFVPYTFFLGGAHVWAGRTGAGGAGSVGGGRHHGTRWGRLTVPRTWPTAASPRWWRQTEPQEHDQLQQHKVGEANCTKNMTNCRKHTRRRCSLVLLMAIIPCRQNNEIEIEFAVLTAQHILETWIWKGKKREKKNKQHLQGVLHTQAYTRVAPQYNDGFVLVVVVVVVLRRSSPEP